MPAGLPSEGLPVLPTMASPTSAPRRWRTLHDMISATGAETEPSRQRTSAGTFSCRALASLLYATTAPRNTSDASGTDEKKEETRPPVHDSADAMVNDRARS